MERKRVRSETALPVPRVIQLDQQHLVYDQAAPKWVVPKPILLEDFVKVESHQDILEFARRWGTLGLCRKHGLPGCQQDGRCTPEQTGVVWREPLAGWLEIVTRACALRKLGEALQNGGSGSEQDWKLTRVADFIEPWKSKAKARLRFRSEMQLWLQLGRIQPSFTWENDRWAIRSTVPSAGMWPLFGYIALYLASAVASGQEPSAICSFCGDEYWPDRRPSPGQRNCCHKVECKRAYWRENKRINKGKETNGETRTK